MRLRAHRRVNVDLNYSFDSSKEEFDFNIAGLGALSPGLAVAKDLPDLRRQNHVLQTSLRVSMHENAALRFFYRFEDSTISDFSQQDLTPALIPGALFLGHVDRDYTVHVFGVTLQVRI